jgi:hypothetical protein
MTPAQDDDAFQRIFSSDSIFPPPISPGLGQPLDTLFSSFLSSLSLNPEQVSSTPLVSDSPDLHDNFLPYSQDHFTSPSGSNLSDVPAFSNVSSPPFKAEDRLKSFSSEELRSCLGEIPNDLALRNQWAPFVAECFVNKGLIQPGEQKCVERFLQTRLDTLKKQNNQVNNLLSNHKKCLSPAVFSRLEQYQNLYKPFLKKTVSEKRETWKIQKEQLCYLFDWILWGHSPGGRFNFGSYSKTCNKCFPFGNVIPPSSSSSQESTSQSGFSPQPASPNDLHLEEYLLLPTLISHPSSSNELPLEEHQPLEFTIPQPTPSNELYLEELLPLESWILFSPSPYEDEEKMKGRLQERINYFDLEFCKAPIFELNSMCLFASLAHLLHLPSVNEVRARIVEWLKRNQGYSPDGVPYTLQFLIGGRDWNEYCDGIARGIVWAEKTALVAASEIWKRSILIIVANPLNHSRVKITPRDIYDDRHTLIFGCWHGKYYPYYLPLERKLNIEFNPDTLTKFQRKELDVHFENPLFFLSFWSKVSLDRIPYLKGRIRKSPDHTQYSLQESIVDALMRHHSGISTHVPPECETLSQDIVKGDWVAAKSKISFFNPEIASKSDVCSPLWLALAFHPKNTALRDEFIFSYLLNTDALIWKKESTFVRYEWCRPNFPLWWIEGSYPIHMAVIHGDLKIIEKLYQTAFDRSKRIELLNLRNAAGLTPLHLALLSKWKGVWKQNQRWVEEDDTTVLSWLLFRGADPLLSSTQYGFEFTPLCAAIFQKRQADFDMLFQHIVEEVEDQAIPLNKWLAWLIAAMDSSDVVLAELVDDRLLRKVDRPGNLSSPMLYLKHPYDHQPFNSFCEFYKEQQTVLLEYAPNSKEFRCEAKNGYFGKNEWYDYPDRLNTELLEPPDDYVIPPIKIQTLLEIIKKKNRYIGEIRSKIERPSSSSSSSSQFVNNSLIDD